MYATDRVVLRWRRSFSTALIRWFGTIMSAVSLVVLYKSGNISFFLGSCFIFIACPLLLEYLERGYLISYDDDAVYMRPPGLNWRLRRYADIRIPFEEIALVVGERGARSVSYGNRFTPFEYARVYRRDGNEDEVFALVGGQLVDEDLRDVLQIIGERAPGALDDSVVKWLQGDQRF